MSVPMVTRTGVFDLQVCVPENWSNDQIKEFTERQNPIGTKGGWFVCEEGHEILGGDPARVPCEANEGYIHVRLIV